MQKRVLLVEIKTLKKAGTLFSWQKSIGSYFGLSIEILCTRIAHRAAKLPELINLPQLQSG